MTAASTIMAVFVAVSWPFLARARIMLSLVSTVAETPGFHRTITVRHSGARIVLLAHDWAEDSRTCALVDGDLPVHGDLFTVKRGHPHGKAERAGGCRGARDESRVAVRIPRSDLQSRRKLSF